jgi:hypothetical protein
MSRKMLLGIRDRVESVVLIPFSPQRRTTTIPRLSTETIDIKGARQ